MKVKRLICLLLVSIVMGCGGGGQDTETPPLPDGETALQTALDNLPDGGLLKIAPGIYRENLVVSGKRVHLQGTPHKTIIDGQGDTCLTINDASGSFITGLTFMNGEDGISTDSTLTIEDNRFINSVDGVDYEGGGGVLENNVFHGNRDDAVDLDLDVAVIIRFNLISASGDDGIEIRLHPYAGDALKITIQGNTVTGNRANGIQVIDYEVETNRSFEIVANTFIENGYNGIAFSDNQNTAPSFDIGDISEPIIVINNTFYPTRYAFTGSGPDTVFQGNTVFIVSGEGGVNTPPGFPVADNTYIGKD